MAISAPDDEDEPGDPDQVDERLDEDLEVDVGRVLPGECGLREDVAQRARIVVDGRLVRRALDEVVVHAGVEVEPLAVTGHRNDSAVAVVVRAFHAR